MIATKRSDIEIMELLLSLNASVTVKDESGKTALMHACICDNLQAAKVLHRNGAPFEDFDFGGSSPLHHAVDSGSCEIISWMIRVGADVDIRDKNAAWTPLMRCASLSGNKSVAKTLIFDGANIDLRDNDGKTCLIIAVMNDHEQLVELLLESNVNVTILNKSGRTAYEIAVALKKTAIIKILDKYIKSRKNNIPKEETRNVSVT
ncbi:fibronectin type 3 and ankyrin repeat domains 1 protein-like isoform X2 [Octopus sinensis]|nr:fibronectin type 3 and ankyrin repeat domains 1 protein-like isoform X2 [Octopus sinensis]XP_036364635.1 fibronectin type 3 and ankyrin repeat domains 1 protein-like isoform X2 [Octopus sinensis]